MFDCEEHGFLLSSHVMLNMQCVALHQVSLVYLMHFTDHGLVCGLHNACIISVFDLHVDSCVEAGGVLEYCASTTLITYVVYTYYI